jgi:hypothetical protein
MQKRKFSSLLQGYKSHNIKEELRGLKNRGETLGKPYNRAKKNRGGGTKQEQKEQRQKY